MYIGLPSNIFLPLPLNSISLYLCQAANPGCILEDFVRWHSPPDWTESETSDEAKEAAVDTDLQSTKGQLSGRMQKEGTYSYYKTL